MSVYKTILAVRAFDEQAAVAMRDLRHQHISNRPFVVAYIQMAGEPFSVWGVLCGRDPGEPTWISCADPRNRDAQNAVFEKFAKKMNGAVRTTLRHDLEPLQVWVSNAGAAGNLRRIGRVMRARQVSEEVSFCGALLDVYAQASGTPGSSLCIAATQALSQVRVTGQSSLEDENLAAQLVWWDRGFLAEIDAGVSRRKAHAMSVFEAAERAERLAMGTLTNPTEDESTLQPLVEEFNELKRADRPTRSAESAIGAALRGQAEPIWRAIWASIAYLRAVPASVSSDDRWATDADVFRRQLDWLERGGHRRFVDSPMQAARLLATWEKAQGEMERLIVSEDDGALVEALLDGKALVGDVRSVEHRKVSARGSHPFVVVRVPTTELAEGTKVFWRENLKVEGVIRVVAGGPRRTDVEVEITAGMTKNVMPEVGDRIAFITHDKPFPMQPRLPRDLPWTHHGDDTPDVDEGDDD